MTPLLVIDIRQHNIIGGASSHLRWTKYSENFSPKMWRDSILLETTHNLRNQSEMVRNIWKRRIKLETYEGRVVLKPNYDSTTLIEHIPIYILDDTFWGL